MITDEEKARRRRVMDKAATLMGRRSRETDEILRRRLADTIHAGISIAQGVEAMSVEEALARIRSVGPLTDETAKRESQDDQ
jgi:hypothetical protein